GRMLLQRALRLAASGSGGGRCCRQRRSFQASRVPDPQLRNQLPSPVERDEFTVLKCLAGTVSVEADAVPHYAIDDSLFLRYRQGDLMLARRSGRNLARRFLQSDAAQLAQLNMECPPVPAWRPLRSVDGLENNEENLRLLIDLEQVDLSWRMYNKLISDGSGVSDDVKQSLLELLAYHAGSDPPLRDISPEEIYFADRPLVAPAMAELAAAWMASDNPARAVYRSLAQPVSLAAKAAMLKAHCRHGAYAECLDLYAEVAEDPQLDAESHVAALLAVGAHRRSWPAVLAAFRRLPGQPDASAYRALLSGLALAKDAPDGGRAKLVCSLLAEMRERGVETRLSLATGTAALRAAYADQLKNSLLDKLQGPTEWLSNPGLPPAARPGLLPSLLADLCSNPPDPLDTASPDDLAFFPTAAYLACRVYASRALSEQLDSLLHSGAFVSTLGTFKERRIVYEYHLLNLLTDRGADLDAAINYYSDRIEPSGVAMLSHLIRLMRKCVAKQAVHRLPGLMARCLQFAELTNPNILAPGKAFYRCAEIVEEMFADQHPAVRDPQFMAELRRSLAGFSDVLNNEFVYDRRRRRRDDALQISSIQSEMTSDHAATLIRLASQLPADSDREQALRLANQLDKCLTDKRVSSLSYCLALLELAAKMRQTPSYEQRAACLAVIELLDRTAHEFQAKRIDKSDTASLARLSNLAESASAFLANAGHRLSETQSDAHKRLSRAAAELRDRGAAGSSWARGGYDGDDDDEDKFSAKGVNDNDDDEAAWMAVEAAEAQAEAQASSRVRNDSTWTVPDSESEDDDDGNKGR
ncbi:hypothetical protein BOX15_Mlig023563g2, partial [Macrostomum lignano]